MAQGSERLTAPPGNETPTVTEQVALREKFTDAEREALIADGALIYTLAGETIATQRESQAKKGKLSFGFIVVASDRVVAVPSRKVQIAIYPAPDRFFVPESFSKNVRQQEEVVEADAADLRKRLGQEGLGEIIPDEASTLTDIIFQHLDETGEWLFGQKYAEARGLTRVVYGRTKNPTNRAGSDVAHVGDADPDYGVSVSEWSPNAGGLDLGAVRIIVPIETK